jgi:hypothetical protein
VKVEITVTDTLLFFDVPELILAKNRIGSRYLCLLVNDSDAEMVYLCTAVSQSRLDDLMSAVTDLRGVFEEPELNTHYIMSTAFNSEWNTIDPVDAIEPSWLPDPGFYLPPTLQADEEICEVSRDRNRAIVHLTMKGDQVLEGNSVSVPDLSSAITLYQSLIKQAYLRSASLYRGFSLDQDAFRMDVIGFGLGSFTVKLQSRVLADAFGYVETVKALNEIAKLTEDIGDDIENATRVLVNYKGSFLKAYSGFLRFIVNRNADMAIRWVIPESKEPHFQNFDRTYAKALCSVIDDSRDLTVENVDIAGRVTRAHVETGYWMVVSDDGEEYSGKLDSSSEITLNGITLGADYRFRCSKTLQISSLGDEKSIYTVYEINER